MNTKSDKQEALRPLRNAGRGIIRRIFDLQVASTYRGIYPYISKITSTKKGKVVDVGCGAMPYRGLFGEEWEYQGIDTVDSSENFDYTANGVIYYDGVTFPLENESMDLVFHSEVIEHIFDTNYFLSECNRVLKAGGEMVFTVPFQARFHYVPYDYWRFTASSIRMLLENNGFSDIEIVPRSKDICVAAYKVLTLGYRLFFSRSWWRMLLAVLFCWIWIAGLIIGQISLHCELGADEDCLGYIVYCKKRNV